MKTYEIHTKDKRIIKVDCGGHYIDFEENMFCLGTYDEDTDIVYDQVGIPLKNLSYYKILHVYELNDPDKILH